MALCTCPKCGHAWNYRGAASQPDEYICCPRCARKVPLGDARQYNHPADEIEAGVRDLVEATRHRATVSRRRVGDREEICVEVPMATPYEQYLQDTLDVLTLDEIEDLLQYEPNEVECETWGITPGECIRALEEAARIKSQLMRKPDRD